MATLSETRASRLLEGLRQPHFVVYDDGLVQQLVSAIVLRDLVSQPLLKLNVSIFQVVSLLSGQSLYATHTD